MRPSHRVLFAAMALGALSCDRPPTAVNAVAPVEETGNLMDPSVALTGQFDLGNYGGCAVAADGTVRCWGENSFGNAPLSRTAASSTFRQVSVGEHFSSCAVRWDGDIECFGQNSFGQSPALVDGVAGAFTQVSVGSLHACGLIAGGGSFECWGNNSAGHAPSSKSAPGSGITYTAVETAYGNFTCAVRSDGKVDCIGMPPFNGVTFQQTDRVFKSVVVGWDFMCALRGDGRAKCFGDNAWGQSPTLRQPATGTFKQIAAGGNHACGVRTDGVAECWGRNDAGQAPATRAASQGTFVRVSAGTNHTCGYTTMKVVECWGDNTFNQADSPFTLKFRFNGLSGQWKTATYPAANPFQLEANHDRRVRIQFSLGSNEGLNIFAPGFPQRIPLNCGSLSEITYGSATTGTLSYDATKNRYTYEWVLRPWDAGCWKFLVKFTDGTESAANFELLGVPASLTIQSGNNQSAYAGYTTSGATLRLGGDFGNPIRNATVNFTVIQGGGSLAASTALTDDDGYVDAPEWTLGKSDVPQKIRASVGELSVDVAASVTTDFDVDVRFFGPTMSAAAQSAFTKAAARLRGLIVEDVPNVAYVNEDFDFCVQTDIAPVTETVDDILIFATAASIDGPGSVLAEAGVCGANSGGTVSVAFVRLDSDDLEAVMGDGMLEDLVLHEMLHALGFGILWEPMSLIDGASSGDPRYIGSTGRLMCEAFMFTLCEGGVPLENSVVGGLALSHWREADFPFELMSYLLAPGSGISLLTAGALFDLGFAANIMAADILVYPGLSLRAAPPKPPRGWDRVVKNRIIVKP